MTVNSECEPDLFWALKGGGPSTYAIVPTATLRAYPELTTSGATLYLNFTHTTDADVYWEGMTLFHKHSNHFVDNGLCVYFELVSGLFRVKPFVAINQTSEALSSILAPLVADLDGAGVPYDLYYHDYPTFGPLLRPLRGRGAGDIFPDGRVVLHARRRVREQRRDNRGVQDGHESRGDLAGQGVMIGHLWNAGFGRPESNSATNPLFREASDFIITSIHVPVGASIREKEDLQGVLGDVMDEALRGVGKYGCAYVNEVSFLI